MLAQVVDDAPRPAPPTPGPDADNLHAERLPGSIVVGGRGNRYVSNIRYELDNSMPPNLQSWNVKHSRSDKSGAVDLAVAGWPPSIEWSR